MDHVLLLPAGGLTIFDASLVSTSLVLVFGLLILLCLIITLEGKIFDSINAKKRAQAQDALHVGNHPAPAVPSAPAPAAAPAAPAAPAVEGGIPGEIIAAISAMRFSAALICSDNTLYRAVASAVFVSKSA